MERRASRGSMDEGARTEGAGRSGFDSVQELEHGLTQPQPALVDAIRQLDGDILVLGAGGKMGPTLTALAQRAVEEAQSGKRVVAVSRFSNPAAAEALADLGVETIPCDLMDEKALQSLPEVRNVIYMVGTKFGATGNEARTWAINAYLPGRVALKFKQSRIVVFSSGNVYPFSPVSAGGSRESAAPGPVGEYAQSVLGRERVFEHFCRQFEIPCVFFRLNYAIEMRYGVLLDIARKVWLGQEIDVTMGHVNVLWQGDANAYALRSLLLADVPPRVLNVTGPETISVRSVAVQFGELLDRRPSFVGQEAPHALLSNAQAAFQLLGYPSVSLGQMIEWVADWVIRGGEMLDKPTKFQVRNGKF